MKLSFHDILVNKHTLLGLTSLIKSNFPSLSHWSLSTLFFFFFLLIFYYFCYSKQNLRSKISSTSKDKRISTLPIRDLSSPIYLPFFVLHPSHVDPSYEQHLNAAQPRVVWTPAMTWPNWNGGYGFGFSNCESQASNFQMIIIWLDYPFNPSFLVVKFN